MDEHRDGTSTGGPTAEAVDRWRGYCAAIDELADVAGVINAAHGRLVDLTILTLADGHHVGPGLHTPAQYLCWRLGVGRATAGALVRIARRADELPHLLAALRRGEISLEQAEVVARHVPAAYDQGATELAKTATVAQLKKVLPHYRAEEGAPRPPRPCGVTSTRDDDGTAVVRARLHADQAELVERALAAMRDHLVRQRRGEDDPVPSSDEVLAAVAEASLRYGEAAHPGADRYLLTYHLHAGPDGRIALTDHLGRAVAEPERRRLLCDHRLQAVFHDVHGRPLSVGRRTRTIGDALRRAVLLRHGGTCAVPGCDRSLGLEVHHIVHWEDGGATDAENLVALCGHHHRSHHLGLLVVAGDADHLEISTPVRAPVRAPAPRPVCGAETARTVERLRRELRRRIRPRTPARRVHAPVASTPTGERLRPRDVHLATPMRT